MLHLYWFSLRCSLSCTAVISTTGHSILWIKGVRYLGSIVCYCVCGHCGYSRVIYITLIEIFNVAWMLSLVEFV